MGRTQLSAVLLVVCAVKCLAISSDELEDFEEYIKRTSQLSPILKKGVAADEYDVGDDVSDNAWEKSGKFEGDLILNDRQRKLIVENVAEGLSRNGLRDGTKRWPNSEVIYYIQVEHFTNDQVQAIMGGIDDLARASCIKFRRYRKGDRDAVVIQGTRAGCFSQVGYQGGYQVLNLSGRHPVGRGCFRHGTIVHEMLHTLGFYHMQSSPERDDYVDIQWENIVQRARHNFRKYNAFSVSNFGVGYDYDSVLHYSRRAFSANGQDTIVPKKVGAEIGQRVGLSDKDVQKLNRMYCDADADLPPADEINNNESKKKSIRNKPLDIYGIGYHQGKAVIIKVLPRSETSNLPEVPTSYVFDYFSKAPHILSTKEKEIFRIGKKIAELYEPITKQDYIEPVDNKTEAEKFSYLSHEHGHDNFAKVKDMTNAKIEIPNKVIEEVKLVPNGDDTTAPAVIEPFDRLSKIIKSHVYPSQNPDLSIYKTHDRSMEYDDVSEDEVKKENAALLIPVTPMKHEISQAEKMQSVMHYINNLYNSNNHQSMKNVENYYHPENEGDNKHKSKKQDLLIIAELPNENDKSKIDTDPSYVKPFVEHDEKYHNLPHYRPSTGQDAFQKYFSKMHHDEKFSDDDEWHHKYSPYKYNPSRYDDEDNTDYLKSSFVRDGYYSPSVPIRIKQYLVRSPYGLDKYNNVNNEEKR